MNPETKEALTKQRALECRAIRLYISTHPGLTYGQLKFWFKGVKKLRERLEYLLRYDLVRMELSTAFNGNVERWFVVRK